MSPETETNLALLMAALRYLQEQGADVPPPGQITPENLSALSRELGCPVSAKTIRRTTDTAIAKARHRATERGLSFFLPPES